MPRSAKSHPTSRPRSTKAAQLEAKSRRMLEEVLAPWSVRRWTEEDVGIDAVVEVTDALPDTSDREASGLVFGVQLKATEAKRAPRSVRVTSGHLQYWLYHSMPVLLVSAYIPTGRLQGCWIDGELLSHLRARNPTFLAQKTISVPLRFNLTHEMKGDLELQTRQHHARPRRIQPGRFHALRRRTEELAERIGEVAAQAGLDLPAHDIAQVRADLSRAAYLVAVAGPQRVGKSTLVNALLGMRVSPVADYPTTAVPLLFEAGATPEATVTFASGPSSQVEATAEALRPFAAQQANAANSQRVQLIRVKLPSPTLASGIALIDTPGLHDASEDVRSVTRAALDGADAVLYVLDASLGAKFSLGRAEIEDLRQLMAEKERVIVLLNQADDLDPSKRPGMAQYVEGELRRYGVWSGLAGPPRFVSGQVASVCRARGRAPPPEFAELEDAIWGHLLRSRATGVHRVFNGVTRLEASASAALALLGTRLRDGAAADEVATVRSTCAGARRTLGTRTLRTKHSLAGRLGDEFAAARGQHLESLVRDLTSIRTLKELPDAEDLRTLLKGQAESDLANAVEVVSSEAHAFEVWASNEVRQAIHDAGAELGLNPLPRAMLALPRNLPTVDLFVPEQAWVLAGLPGFLVNPVVGIITTVGAWLVGLGIGTTRRLKGARLDLAKAYAGAQAKVYTDLASQTHQRSDAAIDHVSKLALARLDTFLRDADRQLAHLGEPVNRVEAQRLEELSASLDVRRKETRVLLQELALLAAGVESDVSTAPGAPRSCQ